MKNSCGGVVDFESTLFHATGLGETGQAVSGWVSLWEVTA